MRFELRGYQADAVEETVDLIHEGQARFEKHRNKFTAISMAAPTGAGKTVMATAVIEQLLFGGEGFDSRPNTTVLWVTDDPNLNQQTRKKMMVASDLLEPRQVVVVDRTFDQRTFDTGRVYFIHIQQLGAGATNYNEVGDRRTFALWDTIGNTLTERGSDVLLIIDEAHRGTGRASGTSITQRVAEGNHDRFPPVPVVLGISATPDRFIKAVTEKTQRTLERVEADEEEVRESGLIKDVVQIKHPAESQPSDSTLLELAVADLKASDEAWSRYAREQGEPEVRPVLVVQVRPSVSNAELAERLATIEAAWAPLSGLAVAHCFQDHTTLDLGGDRKVRYILPQDIQGDPEVRVVLFKEALTTGWDCPRAEVMVSFRAAQDHTYIAQLIGRMVRTPLARRITTVSELNDVSLYLPFFDAAGVAAVIKYLADDEGMPPSRIEVQPIVCGRNPAVDADAWDKLSHLPTYTRPSRTHTNEVARLNALATLLVGNGLRKSAMTDARTLIVSTLQTQSELLGEDLEVTVADLKQLDFVVTKYDTRTQAQKTSVSQARVNARNIEDLFTRARRRLGDAAAKWFWDALCDDGMNPSEARIRVSAVASRDSVCDALNAAASSLIDSWRTAYMGQINDLPEKDRDQFYEVWRRATAPQLISPIFPTSVSAASERLEGAGQSAVLVPIDRLPKHLFEHEGGFPFRPASSWESEVLEAELAKETLVAWYKNPTGGQAAIAVPYEDAGVAQTLYPDFLFLHERDGQLVVDIVDPHRPNEADTVPKWRGLAAFAERHGAAYGRILAVIKEGEELRSLDLRNPDVRGRLQEAAGEAGVRQLFADLGGSY